MNIEPLPKKLYRRARAAGVSIIELNFSGGSDEGFLNITLNEGDLSNHALETDIENWAWEVYEYSGAGDGSDYGDDIKYDLENMKATHSDWCMTRQDGAEYADDFELSEEDDDEQEDAEPHTEHDTFVARVRGLVTTVAGMTPHSDYLFITVINEARAIIKNPRWESKP